MIMFMFKRVSERCGREEDEGFTLIEVVVSMVVMTIFLTIFTGAVVQMFRAANHSDAVFSSQSQLSTAFQRLDREIRYASAISAPAIVGTDPYVEYLISNTTTPTCAELRLHVTAGVSQLQLRKWSQGVLPLVPGPWILLATGVQAWPADIAAARSPFTFSDADSTLNFQRLRLRLVGTAGTGTTAATKRTDITFTALNTSLGTPATPVCIEGRAIL